MEAREERLRRMERDYEEREERRRARDRDHRTRLMRGLGPAHSMVPVESAWASGPVSRDHVRIIPE